MGLGNKALLIFFTGTLGIIIGGPIALYAVSFFSEPFHLAAQEGGYWKGLVTITGSWIGGSSSQLALKEIYGCSEELFVIILVIDALVAVRGIGRWTAEMFLIFYLLRPNVLPLDDVGLINGISKNYFSGEPVSRSDAREVAEAWRPYSTVATWYIWRSLDPLPVEY